MVSNSLDGGIAGITLSPTNTGGTSGVPFDDVQIPVGASLVFDPTHARGGVGLAAKHIVKPGQGASYGWSTTFGDHTLWYGRLYVWVDRIRGDLRVVRAADGGVQELAIDVVKGGRVRVRGANEVTLGVTSQGIQTRGWVRIEWMVDHAAGRVELRLFNNPNATTPTETLRTGSGAAIGSATDEVWFGPDGPQPSTATFWTDDAALGSAGYLGRAA
jgi:hypothetical protein